MDSFIDRLDDALVQAARAIHQDQRRAAAGARRFAPRTYLAVSATAVAACAAIAVVLLFASGGPGSTTAAYALPVLSGPTHDLTRDAIALPRELARGMDVRHAHGFTAPSGTGYVVLSDDGDELCLAVADPPAGYGVTCGPLQEVRERGLVGQLVSPSADAGRSEVVVVLPRDAPAPELRYADGSTEALRIAGGVASASVKARGVLTVTAAAGETRKVAVRPYEPSGTWFIRCGPGWNVEVDGPEQAAVAEHDAICARAKKP